MKRMHDKKQLGGAYRHFIHFNCNDGAITIVIKMEFYDNHAGRYTASDLTNITAAGKAGYIQHGIHGNGPLVIAADSPTSMTGLFYSVMSSDLQKEQFSVINISGFVDEE